MKRQSFSQRHSKTALSLTIAAFIFIFAAIYLVLNYFEDTQNKTEEAVGSGFNREMPDIIYNGEEYRYKSRQKNILLLGIDTYGDMNTDTEEYGNNGQCDVILLATIDYSDEKVRVIQINRDTMTDVNTFDKNGNSTGKRREQIALAYSYGNGQRAGSKNAADAVSNLLYGVPVNEFFAMNIDAIPILNDAVGGVSVFVEDDFSAVDNTLVQGKTIKLMGEQSTNFIRSRMNVGEGNNTDRMRRQRTYLKALETVMREKLAEEKELIVDIDKELAPHRYSSMTAATIMMLFEDVSAFEREEVFVPYGEVDYSHEWVQVTLDDNSLREYIVNNFYEKKENIDTEA